MPKIPFADVRYFPKELTSEYKVVTRLTEFLLNYRKAAGTAGRGVGVSGMDRERIRRRAQAYVSLVSRKSGMGHLESKEQERLKDFRRGAQVQGVESEHRADEIASALHMEMPWMAPATESVWHDLRASVRRGDAAPRIRPFLLVGPPGIGKSHWARLLGDELQVPTRVVEATSEPASFSVTGSQKGWRDAGPGKPLESILASGIANPVVVVDEIEKAGSVHSSRGQSYDLSESLLPLLELSTAAHWECPYFRVKFDMSWITWVLTANTLRGLSAPFLSRCPPLELTALSQAQLTDFARREGTRRGLPDDAIDVAIEVLSACRHTNLISLRTALRLLTSLETILNRPVVH
ncbi:MAG: AAA family ATPase [Qipengyuania pacifica]